MSHQLIFKKKIQFNNESQINIKFTLCAKILLIKFQCLKKVKSNVIFITYLKSINFLSQNTILVNLNVYFMANYTIMHNLVGNFIEDVPDSSIAKAFK